MRAKRLILFLTSLLALSACSGKNDSSGSTESGATPTRPEEVQTIEELLSAEKINLINLRGASTFDLLEGDRFVELYTESAKGTLTYSLVSMLTGEEIPLTSNIVNFLEVGKQYYVAVIYDNYDGKTAPLYAYYVDFYDENDPFVWNTYNYRDDLENIMVKADFHDDDAIFNADINDYVKATSYNPQATTISAGIGPDGEPGDFYRIHSSEAGYLGYAEGVLINFAPLHSKKYYRLFDDAEYEIQFDFLLRGSHGIDKGTGVDVPDDEVFCSFSTISQKPSSADHEQAYNRYDFYGIDRLKHITLPVSDYFGANPKLVELKETRPNTKTGWSWMIDKEDIWASNYPTAGSLTHMLETDVYIGNFTITRTKYESEDLGLIDVKTQGSINLANHSAASYELYSLFGGDPKFVRSFDETTLSLEALRGHYRVDAVDASANIVSQITFDAYHSDESIEWGVNPKVSSSVLWGTYDETESRNVTLEVANKSRIPELTEETGEFYKISSPIPEEFHATNFMPAPMHSNAYYEEFADELIEYGMSYKVLVDDADGTLPLYNASIKHDYLKTDPDYDSIVLNPHNSGTYPVKFCFYEYVGGEMYERFLSLDILYQCWKAYCAAIEVTADTNNIVAGASLVSITTHRSNVEKGLTYYVGDLQTFHFDPETKLRYADIQPNAIPEGTNIRSDEERVDFSQYLGAANAKWLRKYGTADRLDVVLKKNGADFANVHSLDLPIAGNLTQGNYAISASISGYEILNGHFGVYDYDPDLEGLDLSNDVGTTATLVDVSSATSFAFENLVGLSAGNAAAIQAKPGLVSYTLTSPIAQDVEAAGTSIAVSAVQKTVYHLELKIKSFVMFSGDLDFYDSTVIRDSDWLYLNEPHLEVRGSAWEISHVTTVPWHGINGSFTKMERPAGNTEDSAVQVSLHPMHSLAYYRLPAVSAYFQNKQLEYHAYGYATNGTSYYSQDNGYWLHNILAARHNQDWLVNADEGFNISTGSDVPTAYPDGTQGHYYFSFFLKGYDKFRQGTDPAYVLFGMVGDGAYITTPQNGSRYTGFALDIYIGNFEVKNI